jgi:3-hydroxybutyryl-CoA dehydrogenase
MQIVVLAKNDQWEILKNTNINIDWIRVENVTEFFQIKNATLYFNLLDDSADVDYSNLSEPIIINSVSKTLYEIQAAKNVVRLNAWQGFLEKDMWEMAGEVTPFLVAFFEKINKKFIIVKDEPGFVSARTIAMIINEAYFAITDNISTKAEIDIAMKLGTNYPYGPFEWASILGENNIIALLKHLLKSDKRYEIAPALLAKNIN